MTSYHVAAYYNTKLYNLYSCNFTLDLNLLNILNNREKIIVFIIFIKLMKDSDGTMESTTISNGLCQQDTQVN